MHSSSSPDPAPTGAARVLAVLRYVAEQPNGCSLGTIAADMGAPKSSLHRALAALVEAGLIRRTEGGTYHLGYDFLQLAFRYHEAHDVIQAIMPVLTRLADEFGETTHYGVLVGADIVYQAKVAPRRVAYSMTSMVGGANPAYRTGVGKSLLMHKLLDLAAVEAFVEGHGPLERRTPHTLTTAAALHQDLTESRRRGYALDNEENELGVGCVALPLFLGSATTPTGAISISAVLSRTPVADLAARIDDIRTIIVDGLGDVVQRPASSP